jgi:hypothetical protein
MILHGNNILSAFFQMTGYANEVYDPSLAGAAYIPRRMANATDWVNPLSARLHRSIELQSKFLMAASSAGRRSRIAVPPPGTESTTKLP